MNTIAAAVKNHFLSGVLVVVPLILTYLVLRFLFDTIDNLLQPMLLNVLGYYIPGLGIVTTILLILLAGILTRNIIGARVHSLGESLLIRMPLVRPVYSAAKQLLEAITLPTVQSFKEVVLVEYPRRGAFQLGFLSNRMTLESEGNPRKYVSVFIPSTPTPVSGNVVLVPVEDVRPVQMTVEEGVKFLVSGGVTAPGNIQFKQATQNSNSNEVIGETG